MRNLFRVRLRRFKNAIKHFGPKKYFLFFLFGLLILLLMGFFFVKIFGFLYNQEEFPFVFKLFLSEKILMMAFLTMFIMLILSALISTLDIFFRSKDLNLLLSSPLPSGTVFVWKGIEVSINSSIMVIFFSLPLLFSYCYYFASGVTDIIGVVFVFILFIISGVLVGILIGLVIPIFFSIKRLQLTLSLVSVLLISFIVIFLRLLRPEKFGNPDVINNLLEYMSGFNVKGFLYFPFYWISKSLNFIAKQEYINCLKMIGLFIVLIFLLMVLIWFFQKKYYIKLFDKLKKDTYGGIYSKWKKKFIKGDYGTLWKKEIKTFLRTPSQWSQLLIIGAIVVIFIINMKGIPIPHPSIKIFIAYLNLGMAALIVAGLNSRFTFTTIPMENPGIVHLMASPFEKKKLIKFKLLFFAIPQIIIGFILFFTGDIALHLDSFIMLSGSIFLLPTLPFLTIIAVFFSLKIREPVILTPQHLIASRHGISYMLWSLVYIILGMIYFIRPLFLFYYRRHLKQQIPVLEISLWYVGFILLNIFLICYFLKKALSQWKKREFT